MQVRGPRLEVLEAQSDLTLTELLGSGTYGEQALVQQCAIAAECVRVGCSALLLLERMQPPPAAAAARWLRPACSSMRLPPALHADCVAQLLSFPPPAACDKYKGALLGCL